MKKVKISDISPSLIKGVGFGKSDARMSKEIDYTPLLRANNIKDMNINLDKLMYVKSALVKDEQFLKEGDIIFVTSSGSKHLVGKSAFVSNLQDSITIGAFNSLIRFPENIYSRYVFYALNSTSYKQHIAGRLAGANINNIKRNDVLDFEFFIPFKNDKPDLTEQKRIADELDKIFSETEKGLSLTQKNNRLAETFKQTLLSTISSNQKWNKITLFDLLSPISNQVQPKDFDGKIYIGLEHIKSGDIVLRDKGTTDQVKSTKWKFQAGDILYGKLRPYLNKCAVAEVEGVCSTDVLVLRAKENFYPNYIAYALIGKKFVDFSNSTVSGMNLPRTTWSKINCYEIFVPFKNGKPDLAEQKRIAVELEKVATQSENLSNLFVKQSKAFFALRSSVLNQSFQMQT